MGEKATVLLVEDEPSIRELLQQFLNLENYRVLSSANGRDALEVFRKNRPDIIVTDLMMPVMDGLEFIECLRKQPGFRTPVIAMSAMPEYLSEARKLGATADIKKPLKLSELISLVACALTNSRKFKQEPPIIFPPEKEQRRLQAIHSLGLDRPVGENLDHYAKKVANLFDVQTCLVSIITEVAQYWTSGFGIPAPFEPTRGGVKSEAFCALAVESRSSLIVQNAPENPIFERNVFVTECGLRFYAGVPISDFLGHVVGTFCLLDFKPRRFSSHDLELLSFLSIRVMAEFDQRARRIYPDLPESSLRFHDYYDEKLNIAGRLAFHDLANIMSHWCLSRSIPLGLIVLASDEISIEKLCSRLNEEEGKLWCGRLGERRLGILTPGRHSEEAARDIAARFEEEVVIEMGDVAFSVESFEEILTDIEDRLEDRGLFKTDRAKKAA